MVAKIASWVVRLGGLALIVLGLLFWSGNALTLKNEHETLGIIVVLALWTLAFVALRKGVNVGLVVGGLLLGVVVIAFGMTQTSLMSGSTRMVADTIKVIHLLLGLGLISLGEVLTGRIRRIGQGGKPVAA
ncbi:MAG TPA: hypothetical protein VFQ32_06705 [Ktedonobacterales bacterium]|nr:hypothetical protein [Ktedonobacterales bacterium]